jgi:two-component system NarL family sensor kinase
MSTYMEKSQLMFFICFSSLLLIVLLGFLLLILLVQRSKSNRFIREREKLKIEFNEQLLSAQLEIQEQSFNTISMEIHDNVGQTLSLLNVQLNIIERKEIMDKALIAEARESAKKAMTDLRDIAKSLSTERIQLSGLSQIAAHETQRLNQTGIMNAVFNIEGQEQFIEDEKKLILFRIIQECFQNIIKHSHATNVAVGFAYRQKELVITIKDDGLGFDIDLTASNPHKGLGLQNIVKRAKIIKGTAMINSVPKHGTTIVIVTPYV